MGKRRDKKREEGSNDLRSVEWTHAGTPWGKVPSVSKSQSSRGITSLAGCCRVYGPSLNSRRDKLTRGRKREGGSRLPSWNFHLRSGETLTRLRKNLNGNPGIVWYLRRGSNFSVPASSPRSWRSCNSRRFKLALHRSYIAPDRIIRIVNTGQGGKLKRIRCLNVRIRVKLMRFTQLCDLCIKCDFA